MQTVHLAEATGEVGMSCQLVPLRGQQLKVVVDKWLELQNILVREDMGDGLSLAGVFGTVTGVEEAALDGDKGIIIFPAATAQPYIPLPEPERLTTSKTQCCGRR
jgi:hypothetical protein